jgi:hypothetical protein
VVFWLKAVYPFSLIQSGSAFLPIVTGFYQSTRSLKPDINNELKSPQMVKA